MVGVWLLFSMFSMSSLVYVSLSRFFYLLESNFDTPSTTQKIRNYIPIGVSCIKGSLQNTSKSHTSEHLQSQHTLRTLNLSKMQHVTTYCASIEAITSASRSHYLCAVLSRRFLGARRLDVQRLSQIPQLHLASPSYVCNMMDAMGI